MRISDTERQRTIDELRRHCAAGRIDVDEYAERIEKAMGAATLEDLDAVLHDLPILRIADPTGPGERESSRSLLERAAVGSGDASGGRRFMAAVTVLMTVAIVVAAALLLFVVSWGWALVLLGGWVAGLVQGRALRRRRPG